MAEAVTQFSSDLVPLQPQDRTAHRSAFASDNCPSRSLDLAVPNSNSGSALAPHELEQAVA